MIEAIRRAWSRLNRQKIDQEELSRQPWFKLLEKCQQTIAENDPHPHYLSRYRKDEFSYWIPLARWLYEEAKRKPVGKLLDVGCAYGTLSLYCRELYGCDVYCTDFVDTFLSKKLIEKFDFRFKVSNIELEEIPWRESFDLIVFTEVLEHLNFNALPTLMKFRESLAADGRIYLSTPDALQWKKTTKYYKSFRDIPFPQPGMPVIDDHVWHYSKNELSTLISDAGLRAVNFDYSPGLGRRHFNAVLKPT